MRGRVIVVLLGLSIGFLLPLTTPPLTASAASAGCVGPVASWSVAQRLEQLLMVSGQFSNLGASGPMASAGVGGFVLYGQPAAGSGPSIRSGLAALANDATVAGQVVPWMSTDEEGGNVARLSFVIGALPSARRMAAIWSPSQVTANLASHGSAMLSLGITMDLAPVLDTASPTNTIADENDRSFSENAQVAGVYGLAFANGLRTGGIVPVVKHFPGLGHATANTDVGASTDPALTQLEGHDLVPFQQAIADGLPVVMVGHMSVPGLTAGLPASLSPATYGFLRSTLHFGGVTMTDSLSAGAITAAGYSQTSAAVAAVEAGSDMVMINASAWQATLTALQAAVNSGALSLTTVNAAVTRIVSTKGLQICPATWTSLGGVMVGGATVASMDAGRLDLFVRGTDDGLWHRWWNGSSWSGWESLGGRLNAAPAAVAWGPNRLDVFVRGTDNALWHRGWDGVAWSAWEPLGGGLSSAPAVAAWGPNRLDIFVRGTDNALWHKAWIGNGWSPWQPLGGRFASAPAAVSWGLNRIDVFATSGGVLQHIGWNGATWSVWQTLGGGLTSSPATASQGVGLLDVYAMGAGGILQHISWNSAVWSAWSAVDQQVWTADPGAVARGPQVVDLFARGYDGAVWFRETTGG